MTEDISRALPLKRYLGRLLLILFTGFPILFLFPAVVGLTLIRNGIVRRQKDRIFYLQHHGDHYFSDRLRDLLLLSDGMGDPGPEDQFLLAGFLGRHSRFHNLYLTDDSGRILADVGTEFPLDGMDLSADPRFQRVMITAQPDISMKPIAMISLQSVLIMAVPVLRGGVPVGVLFGELDLVRVQSLLVAVDRDTEGLTFIVDRNGTLVVHPEFYWVQQQPNLAENPLVRQGRKHPGHNGLYRASLAGFGAPPQWYIGSSRPMKNGWLIVTVDPLERAIYPLALQTVVSSAVLFLLVFIMMLTLLRYNRRLTLPLERLVRMANRLRMGEYRLDDDPPVSGLYELDLLGLSFINMADEIFRRDRYLEEKVRERTGELVLAREKEAEANRAKSVFLANVSHELRTPLNAILGFSQVLRNAPNLKTSQQENLDVVIRNGERLLKLINEVIALSRMDSRHAELRNTRSDIRDLVQGVVRLFLVPAHKKGLELTVRFDDGLPQLVELDPERFQQIVINLVDNGIKFTESGGVSVTCGFDGRLVLEVKDTGPGIPPENRERIFELFNRTDRPDESGSSGLGLAIVRNTAALMGGSVTVADAPGGGTLFCVILPIRPEGAPEKTFSGKETGKTGKQKKPGVPDETPEVTDYPGFLFRNPELMTRFRKSLRLGDPGGALAVFRDSGQAVPARIREQLFDYRFDEILAGLDQSPDLETEKTHE